MSHRRFLVAFAVTLVTALAGCSEEGTSASSTTTSSTSSTTTPTPSSTPGPVAGSEPSELDGTAWLLPATAAEQQAGGGAAAAVVTFGVGTLDAHDGVNTLAGEYEVDGSGFIIRMGTPTDFPYPEELAGAGLIDRLATVDRAAVEGDRLVLVQGDGTRVLLDPAPVGGAPSG